MRTLCLACALGALHMCASVCAVSAMQKEEPRVKCRRACRLQRQFQQQRQQQFQRQFQWQFRILQREGLQRRWVLREWLQRRWVLLVRLRRLWQWQYGFLWVPRKYAAL